MWTPFHTSSWPSSVNSQLPPLAAAKSTMTEPGRIPLTMAVLTNSGASPSWDGCGRDNDIGGSDVGPDHLLLPGQKLLRLGGRVTTGTFLGFQGEVEERRTKALHFFLGRRP